MFTLQPVNSFEKFLCNKAFNSETPICGTFELLPICNMDCKMCYIRMSPNEMHQQGTPLSVNDWLRIGKEAATSGCMFLLLTGGEPLLYPDFLKLYEGLRYLGIIIALNTNGTLIDKQIAETFKYNQPRRVNISLYGASDNTYKELCGNPKGFTQVMNGIHLLLDAGVQVKINFTPTPQNYHDLEKVIEITENLNIPISTPTYMFPPERKPGEISSHSINRLTPQQAAQEQLKVIRIGHPYLADYINYIKETLEDIKETEEEEVAPPGGLLCTAGISSFWVNWKGEISPCGMLQKPARSLKEHSFKEGWEAIKTETKQIFTSKKCFNCRFRKICKACGAASFAENHDFSLPATYHCELNKAYEELLKEELKKLEQKQTNK